MRMYSGSRIKVLKVVLRKAGGAPRGNTTIRHLALSYNIVMAFSAGFLRIASEALGMTSRSSSVVNEDARTNARSTIVNAYSFESTVPMLCR